MSPAASPVFAENTVSAPALRITVVTEYSDFLALEPAWDDLLRRADIEHPFLEHAWLRTWWECFGENSRLYIIVVTGAERPVAIAPLMLTTIRMWGHTVRRLGFLYNAHVPRADFLIAERAEEVYEAIWRHLCGSRDWDLIQLCQLTAGSSTVDVLQAFAGRNRLPSGVWRSGASPCIPLDRNWQAYCETLAAKHRSNLRNRFGRLNKVGPVELETVAGGERHHSSLAEGLRIEAAGWKGDAGTAICNDAAVTRFYTLFSERAAKRGWLRLNFLRAGAQAVAFDYSLAYRNRMFLLKLGYDPAFSAYSPSNLLLAKTLQSAFDKGFAEYDFLGGEAEWKRCWASHTRPNEWLYIFSPSLKGHFLHSVKFRLIPWLKKKRVPERLAALAARMARRA